MTIAQEKVGMPLGEFIELSNQQPFELINGERRPKLPTVFGPSEVIRLLFRFLDSYALKYGGEAFFETTFVLPNRESGWVTGARIPDLMYYAGNRLAEYKAAYSDYQLRPLAIIPDFVIEVVSPTDRVSELDEKVDTYLSDGVRLIWVIDPQRRKAVVYAPNIEQPRHYGADGVLSDADVLPDFEVDLAKLFA